MRVYITMSPGCEEVIVQIIVCNGLGKCLVEAVCFPLTKRAIKWAKTLE